uniref:hypothetical protein n=1 Tax=Enterocloster clostridioformis TaxID=1531 RepID=UPI00242DA434
LIIHFLHFISISGFYILCRNLAFNPHFTEKMVLIISTSSIGFRQNSQSRQKQEIPFDNFPSL